MTWTRRIREFAGAVVLVALSASPGAAAGEEEKILDGIAQGLRSGFIGPASQYLDDDRFPEMAAAFPSGLRKVCAAAADGRAEFVVTEPEPAKALGARLVEAATLCVEGHADDADALWALALARLVRGRNERDLKGKPDPADWQEAAALLEKAWGISDEGGRGAADGAQALLEASQLPGADAAALAKRADELIERGLAKHPDSGSLLGAWGARAVERATAAVSKKAEAVAILEAAFKRLEPHVKKSDPDLDAATAWNRLVSLQTEKKLGSKADFVTKTVQAKAALTMKVPVSRNFTVLTTGAETRIVQTDGSERVRSFTFEDYSWDTTYDFGSRESPGGDNLKGVATGALGAYRRTLVQESGVKEPAKARLNGRITSAIYWEAGGRASGADADERVRAWFFKSDKQRMQTYQVRVTDARPAELDPAARAILDSIDELDKPK